MVLVNVVSFSSSGGAGNVAQSLTAGFTKIGIKAQLTVSLGSDLRSNPASLPFHTLAAGIDQYVVKKGSWPYLISLKRDELRTFAVQPRRADLYIFRWMNGVIGATDAMDLFAGSKVVWGLDDMNPFTGVCHYSGNCTNFRNGCGDCPAVRRPFEAQVEANLKKKKQLAENLQVEYVAPTDWIMNAFEQSSLGRSRPVVKILNPLRKEFFRAHNPVSKSKATLKLVLVAANLDDPAKGVWSTIHQLEKMSRMAHVKLTLVGTASEKLRSSMPEANFMGSVSSETLLEVLRENDALVVTSLNENAGTVVAEAASQGLPSIARNTGGMPEMTNFGQTGILFENNSMLLDVVCSLSWKRLADMGVLAKEWAQNMKPEIVANEYARHFLN